MKNKILKQIIFSRRCLLRLMLTGFTVSVSAGNDGLIGANIKEDGRAPRILSETAETYKNSRIPSP